VSLNILPVMKIV